MFDLTRINNQKKREKEKKMRGKRRFCSEFLLKGIEILFFKVFTNSRKRSINILLFVRATSSRHHVTFSFVARRYDGNSGLGSPRRLGSVMHRLIRLENVIDIQSFESKL